MNEPLDSPCVRNCCLNQEDICLGCFRNLNEITQWHDADTAERQLILDKAAQRQIEHTEFKRAKK